MAGNSNLTGTRNRETLINQRSKYTYGTPGPAPLLSPSATFGYATQVAGLQQNLAAAMALKRQQIQAARAAATLQRQQAVAQEISNMAGNVNSALDRGIVGSSIDLQARADTKTELGAARAAIVGERSQAVGAAKLGGMQAVGQYYLGLGQVQADKANARAELALQAYQNDQLLAVLQQLQQNQGKPGTRRGLTPDTAPGTFGAAALQQLSIYQQNPNTVDRRVGPHRLFVR